jgi:hypothetical protein
LGADWRGAERGFTTESTEVTEFGGEEEFISPGAERELTTEGTEVTEYG